MTKQKETCETGNPIRTGTPRYLANARDTRLEKRVVGRLSLPEDLCNTGEGVLERGVQIDRRTVSPEE